MEWLPVRILRHKASLTLISLDNAINHDRRAAEIFEQFLYAVASPDLSGRSNLVEGMSLLCGFYSFDFAQDRLERKGDSSRSLS